MNDILIYGLAKEASESYQEDLLACFPDNRLAIENIHRVKAAASAEGFHSFRVASVLGEAPNFATVQSRTTTWAGKTPRK